MNPKRIKQLIEIQKQILQKYAPLVKSKKEILYMLLVSIFPNENQNQIKKKSWS